jgi:TctA family transporter
MLGRTVAVPAEGDFAAGTHRFTFNGSNLASGVYIYRIVAGTFVQSRKMVLQK